MLDLERFPAPAAGARQMTTHSLCERLQWGWDWWRLSNTVELGPLFYGDANGNRPLDMDLLLLEDDQDDPLPPHIFQGVTTKELWRS